MKQQRNLLYIITNC